MIVTQHDDPPSTHRSKVLHLITRLLRGGAELACLARINV